MCSPGDSTMLRSVECLKPTLPDKDPIEPKYIVDGTTSDYDAWKNSWTCWAYGDDYDYCKSPENRDQYNDMQDELSEWCRMDESCD